MRGRDSITPSNVHITLMAVNRSALCCAANREHNRMAADLQMQFVCMQRNWINYAVDSINQMTANLFICRDWRPNRSSFHWLYRQCSSGWASVSSHWFSLNRRQAGGILEYQWPEKKRLEFFESARITAGGSWSKLRNQYTSNKPCLWLQADARHENAAMSKQIRAGWMASIEFLLRPHKVFFVQF